jgi:hypothetical protein
MTTITDVIDQVRGGGGLDYEEALLLVEARSSAAYETWKLRTAIFEICEKVTGGREHLDVEQCIDNIKSALRGHGTISS